MVEIKFEEALKKLEKIVEGLEGGDLPLEESLLRYEEGVKLSRLCQKKLEAARKKVELLTKSKDGKYSLEDFEAETKKKSRKSQK